MSAERKQEFINEADIIEVSVLKVTADYKKATKRIIELNANACVDICVKHKMTGEEAKSLQRRMLAHFNAFIMKKHEEARIRDTSYLLVQEEIRLFNILASSAEMSEQFELLNTALDLLRTQAKKYIRLCALDYRVPKDIRPNGTFIY